MRGAPVCCRVAERHHQTVTQLVLEAGADPNRADREGLTPLDHARRQGQEAVARLIEAAGGRSGAAAPSGQR